MELLSSRDILLTRSTDPPVLYTAFGWIAGSFRPGKRKHDWGELVTLDGQTLKAKLDWRKRRQLKQKQKEPSAEPECLDTVYRWKVYPRSSLLRLDLIKRQPLDSSTAQSKGGLTNQLGQLDEFRIVGEIVGVGEGKVRVCIHRQEPPPLGEEKSLFYQPHTLTLKGNLPSDAILQIWELKARREGAKLVLVASHLYQANPEDITALQGAGKRNVRNKQLYPTDAHDKQHSSNIRAIEPAALSKHVLLSESDSTSVRANKEQQQPNEQVDQKPETIPVADTATQEISSPSNYLPPTILSHQPACNTQPALSTNKPKTPFHTQHQQKKNQSQASRSPRESQQKKPAFQVKVNDQVFSGYNSVTLNNRMLRIDGKAVAGAKMVIVMGQPQSMQADGKVTQRDNQAVLTSR